MALEEQEYTASESYDNYDYYDQYSVFGDEDDLWGAEEILLSSLKDPSFLVKFDADLGEGQYNVDSVSIEVFYEVHEAVVEYATLPPWFEENLQSGCVARANGQKKFVVVGKKGLMRVSDDGQAWADQESGTAETLRAATSTSEGVTAVGDNGVVVNSLDVASWELQASGTLETLIGINSNFAAGNTLVVGSNKAIIARGNSRSNWEKRNG